MAVSPTASGTAAAWPFEAEKAATARSTSPVGGGGGVMA